MDTTGVSVADSVVSIRKVTDKVNPAAVEDTIAKLVAAKYPPPDWVKQGPNFIKSMSTGEVVNLNQEATEILQANPIREDALAVVQSDDGTEQSVWIDQVAVQAAGGDLGQVARNLQATLSPAFNPKMILIIGAGLVGVYFLTRRGKRYA